MARTVSLLALLAPVFAVYNLVGTWSAPAPLSPTDNFALGVGVNRNGTIAFVGGPGRPMGSSPSKSGDAFAWRRPDNTPGTPWSFIGNFTGVAPPPRGNAGGAGNVSQYGASVALCDDVPGLRSPTTTAFVGAPGTGAGLVFAWRNTNTLLSNSTFIQVGIAQPPANSPSGPPARDLFGYAVSCAKSATVDTVFVGSPGRAEGAGAVWNCAPQGTAGGGDYFCAGVPIRAPEKDRQPGAKFGASVSASNEGSAFAVGAPGNNTSAGAAYVYARAGVSTGFTPTLLNASLCKGFGDLKPGMLYGTSVAMSYGGNSVLVGAPRAGSVGDASGQPCGLVFSWEKRTAGGSTGAPTWVCVGFFSPRESASGDGVGTSVALDAKGGKAFIGAPGLQQGFVFDRTVINLYNITGPPWNQTETITAPVQTQYANFGASLAVDNNIFSSVLFGAPGPIRGLGPPPPDGTNIPGTAFMYMANPPTPTATATATPSTTATTTGTTTSSAGSSATPTSTSTETSSGTATSTSTGSASATATQTETMTATATASGTRTAPATATGTHTATATSTASSTETSSATATKSNGATTSVTPTATASNGTDPAGAYNAPVGPTVLAPAASAGIGVAGIAVVGAAIGYFMYNSRLSGTKGGNALRVGKSTNNPLQSIASWKGSKRTKLASSAPNILNLQSEIPARSPTASASSRALNRAPSANRLAFEPTQAASMDSDVSGNSNLSSARNASLRGAKAMYEPLGAAGSPGGFTSRVPAAPPGTPKASAAITVGAGAPSVVMPGMSV